MPRKRKESDKKGQRREKPVQRNAANARERTRMRVLARAFSRLKTTLPWVPADTKLSKLDTLRLATSYISHLRAVLRDETPLGSTKQLTWPFTNLPPQCNTDNVLTAQPSNCNPFSTYGGTRQNCNALDHSQMPYSMENGYPNSAEMYGCYDYYQHTDMMT